MIRKPSLRLNKFNRSAIVDKIGSLPAANNKNRRRMTRYGIMLGNLLLLVAVALFIMFNRTASQTVRNSLTGSFTSATNSSSSTLDQLSTAQISLTAARLAHLPETTAVRNQADSDGILLKTAPNDSQSISKPVIVAIGQKSKQDIKEYTTVAGDTVPAIAEKFGVSADSVRWSNSLAGNAVGTGVKLSIPPVNGIVYTVKAGDTPASLASRFRADEQQIITFNDAEIGGLSAGEKIIIPNGQQSAPAVVFTSSFLATYGGNGYDYGYCTYYVASQISIPTNWGNANTWDNYAALSGWTVSTTPKAGAIAQSDAGWLGHVAIVNEVSDDGTMIKYSDMNGLAGWGRVGHSDWVSSTHFQHYIYH